MRNGLFVLALLGALEISILAGAGIASASEPSVDPESVFDFLPTEPGSILRTTGATSAPNSIASTRGSTF